MIRRGMNRFRVILVAVFLFFLAPFQALADYYTFPRNLTLCGEPVPLEDRRIWERMDREFTLQVYDRAQVILWLKRSHRLFPFVEERLKAKGLPEDLKYLMVAESSLLPRALSNKGAAGFWQFMERTGKRFNLQKKPWLDERLNLAKATEAAMEYLKGLYEQFGKWTLAMAAYNCGEERVKEEILQQGENDFYRLSLPQETERYIFRILAVKVILSDPGTYGYNLSPEDLYPPEESDRVVLELPQTTPIREVAKACGSYFKEFKELNPELLGHSLPPGTYFFHIPKGNKALLENHPVYKNYLKNSP